MLRPLAAVLLVLPLLAAGTASAEGDGTATWRLARSDFLRFERTHLERKDGTEKSKATKIVTIHGHDLRDGGQYSPASPVRGDLFQLLAFRLPAPGSKSTSVKLDWTGRKMAPIRFKGAVGIVEFGKRILKIEGDYTFKSRGKMARDVQWWFDKGKAKTWIEFDLAEGAIRSSRIEIEYEREDMKKSGPAALLDRALIYTYSLKAIERRRPKDFHDRVSKAIDAGEAALRKKQLKDGTWKPHGNYKIGTTALAVLTMLACGVSRDDECVRRALDWIFEQDPERTYEQACCLMAIDRAWMPKEELEALEQGKSVPKPVRKLPPKRMAWVRREAQELERNASGGGGSWGYPANARSALKFDSSNTQYAVLGLRAATRMGHEVNERTWLGVIRHCKEVQERKGPKGKVSIVREGTAIPDERYAHQITIESAAKVAGFRYSTLESHGHVAGSMTCAGIAMLLIARHELRRLECKKFDKKAEKEVAQMIRGGWAWLDRHWAMDRNPVHPSHGWYWYYLYSLERAAVLDSVKRVGGRDWYFEGAMQLLHRQHEKNGDWNDPGGDATAPTCFALLFLKRGTSPLGGPVTGK